MGEIADDMVSGLSCSDCGMYFVEKDGVTLHEHGYPVICQECWKEYTKVERREAAANGLQRATHQTT